jgi:serine/threonine protein kinase
MGTSIARRYVVLGPIGHGGLSVVYEAVDAKVGRRVAVKLPARQFVNNPAAHERMRHEALVTERLRSPSVPRVYDHGETVLPGGWRAPYVAMELITGAMLAGRLAGTALPWREAVTVAATAADVLAVAHRHGIVHRDLTPTNIMLTAAGAKIIDFGEAATVLPPGQSVDRRGLALPDRHFTSAASPADDVYSLGVLLFQMLTGRSPYGSNGPADDLAAARLRRMAPTPVLIVPGMPHELAEVTRRFMDKRADQRPTSAAAALELWALVTPPPAPARHAPLVTAPSWLA